MKEDFDGLLCMRLMRPALHGSPFAALLLDLLELN